MAGIKYYKNGSVIDLTGSEYTGITNQSAEALYVCTGASANAKIKYGLTTDTTASAYSPKIKLNNSIVYIASQFSSSEEKTTGTSYITGESYQTRSSQYTYSTVTDTYRVYDTRSSQYTTRTSYESVQRTSYYNSGSSSKSLNGSTTVPKANGVAGAAAIQAGKINIAHNFVAGVAYNTAYGAARSQASGTRATVTVNVTKTVTGYKNGSVYWETTRTVYETASRSSTSNTRTVTYTVGYETSSRESTSGTITVTTATSYLTTSNSVTSNNCNV